MTDNINPDHYQGFTNGAEVIDITEHLNFCRGNAIKYLARAGVKNPDTEMEDLLKAQWYVDREIARLARGDEPPTETVTVPVPGGVSRTEFLEDIGLLEECYDEERAEAASEDDEVLYVTPVNFTLGAKIKTWDDAVACKYFGFTESDTAA